MIRLLRLMVRYGLRDGLALWRIEGRVLGWASQERRAEQLVPAWRTFHGARPTMPAYRRRR